MKSAAVEYENATSRNAPEPAAREPSRSHVDRSASSAKQRARGCEEEHRPQVDRVDPLHREQPEQHRQVLRIGEDVVVVGDRVEVEERELARPPHLVRLVEEQVVVAVECLGERDGPAPQREQPDGREREAEQRVGANVASQL